MRCVQGMSVTAETEQGRRRLQQLRAHSRVTQVCHVVVGFHVLCVDLGFHVVIGVGRLTINFISPRTRNSKYKVLFFWML